jgi:hypothetical protein
MHGVARCKLVATPLGARIPDAGVPTGGDVRAGAAVEVTAAALITFH